MRAAAWRLMKENEVCGAVQKGDFMVGSLAAAAKATSVDTSALKANFSFISSILVYVWAHYAAAPSLITFVGRFSGCKPTLLYFHCNIGKCSSCMLQWIAPPNTTLQTNFPPNGQCWLMCQREGGSDIKASTTGSRQCLSRDHCEAMRSLFLVRMRA